MHFDDEILDFLKRYVFFWRNMSRIFRFIFLRAGSLSYETIAWQRGIEDMLQMEALEAELFQTNV